MRCFLCVATVCASAFSFASFDLILVTDFAEDCVHRYDGDTGVYLGSFGQAFLDGPKAISLDQANNMVVVEHVNGTSAFNYNTGAHLFTNTVFANSGDSTFIGTNYYRSFSLSSTAAFARITNIQTSTSQSVHSGSLLGPWTGVAADVNGKVFAAESTSGRMLRWTPGITAAEEAISGTTVIRSGLGSTGGFILGLGATGEMVSVNSTSMAVATGTVPLGTAWTSAIDAAAGHGSSAWGLGMTAGGAIIQSYAKHPTTNVYRGLNRISATQMTTPSAMVVVVAPEPSAMLGLGVAVLALLRRRQK